MIDIESEPLLSRRDELAVLMENVRSHQKLLLIPALVAAANLVLMVLLLDSTDAIDRVDLGITLFAALFLGGIGVFLRRLDTYRVLLIGNTITAVILLALLANGVVGTHAGMLAANQMPWFAPYFVLCTCSFFSVMLIRDATRMALGVWLLGIILMLIAGAQDATVRASAAFSWMLLAMIFVPPVVATVMLLQRRIHGATARALAERQHQLKEEYERLREARRRDPDTGVLAAQAALAALDQALGEGREVGLLCIHITNYGTAARIHGSETLNARLGELVGPLRAMTGSLDRCGRMAEDTLIGWLENDDDNQQTLAVAAEVLGQCAPKGLELRMGCHVSRLKPGTGDGLSAEQLINHAWQALAPS